MLTPSWGEHGGKVVIDVKGAVKHLLAAGAKVIEVVLCRGGVGGHLLAGRHLDVLHVLLQVGEVDAHVVEGEREVQDVGVIPTIQLRPVMGNPADSLNIPDKTINVENLVTS